METIEMTRKEASKAGYKAAKNLKELQDNPWVESENPEIYFAWRIGWLEYVHNSLEP